MQKQCPICNEHFETKQVRGGHNRIYCFNCLPYGLPKPERHLLGAKLAAQRVSEYKVNIGCQICGYNKCSKALEFHHVFEDTKVIDPCMAARKSWLNFISEREKCVLLCANCHREQQVGLISQDQILEIFNGK